MKTVDIFGFVVPLWVVGVVAYALIVSFAWAAKRIFFGWLRKFTSRTQTQLDDAILEAINFPLTIMICVWVAAAILQFGIPGIPPQYLKAVTIASKIATLGAVVFFIDGLFIKLFSIYAAKRDFLRASETFSSVVIHVIVLSLGFLMILDSVGISITPIIASLGIGSLAVALALQPTLENLFAGFQIIVDHPVMPGHYIKLESGEDGFVEKIGWRTTWIRQLSNNMVIVPNKLIINGRLNNFNYPSKFQAVIVDLGVHHTSNMEEVERITSEVADEIMQTVEGGVPDFKCFIRYHTFAASSINFSVIMQAQQFTDNFLIKHEFIKALVKRYSKEGIIIPYPTMALNTSQEKASVLAN